jgi:N-acetylmuramoyl-L-alanine amidase
VPKETVRQIQQELRARNDYDGPIDGVMGTKTRPAIRQYQQQQGLNVTGELDTATLQRLTAAAENAPNSNTGSGSSAPANSSAPAQPQ